MGDIQPGEMLCIRQGCGHPADWHRLDDSTNVSPTDPNAKFRCVGYDVSAQFSRPQSCPVSCQTYLPPQEYTDYFLSQDEPPSMLIQRNIFDKSD